MKSMLHHGALAVVTEDADDNPVMVIECSKLV